MAKTPCSNCKKPCDNERAVARNGQVLKGCEHCLDSQLQKGDSAAYSRRMMQTDYRRDLVQPNQPRDFIRAQGTEKAKQYMDDDTIRKYE